MKILIIGSEGFIGNKCVTYFLNKGFKVTGCDLQDYQIKNYNYYKIDVENPSYDKVFNNNLYDLCINASGNGHIQKSIDQPTFDFKANCLDVLNILENIRIHSPHCKYLHLSSAAVYGNVKHLPINEESILQPISPYGWHKLISEKICEEYVNLYQLKIAILRPFSVFGPQLRKQIFWDLYQKIKKEPSKIEVYGTGLESRDFIYIDDLILIIDLIFSKSEMEGQIYNAANGKEILIKDAVKYFVSEFSPKTEVSFSNHQLVGSPINWLADISKIKQLGYQPKNNFSSNLQTLASWMKNLI